MDQLQTIKVSIYRDVWDKTSQETISLLCWLKGLQEHYPTIDLIRQEPDKEKRDAMKKKLPGITASGIFYPERKDENLMKHSGFIALDFDNLVDPEETKQFMAKVVNVFYCGISVSGRGLWALIKLQHSEKHRQQYKALEADFKALGLVTDPRCINISRLRFCSYDPQPVFNMEALPYQKITTEQEWILPQFEPIRRSNGGLDMLIKKIESAQTDITTDYVDWLKLAGAFASIYGEDGRERFHRISRFYNNYNPLETDKQFSACLRNTPNFTENIVFDIAKKYGVYLKN
jgi:hypothetical protein